MFWVHFLVGMRDRKKSVNKVSVLGKSGVSLVFCFRWQIKNKERKGKVIMECSYHRIEKNNIDVYFFIYFLFIYLFCKNMVSFGFSDR